MLRVGVIGLGKMGISHLAILNAHPDVEVAAVCDSNKYVLDGLGKYTGMRTYTDYHRVLRDAALDAVLIATPSALHAPMVQAALDTKRHVFCEKPFCLSAREGAALAALAAERQLVGQVGYHNRFVASFSEAKRLIAAGALGKISHVRAEAFGAVVMKPQGTSWRTQRLAGGGCLYDYAAHPINLVNWMLGTPRAVAGAVLNPIFSSETDDEVYGTIQFAGGVTAQVSVNWSDPSVRKMTTRLTIWGERGKLCCDRQELQLYMRADDGPPPAGYHAGWNTRYTTDLTKSVDYYLRGEEYSAQIWSWIAAIQAGNVDCVNSFASAVETDATLEMFIKDANGEGQLSPVSEPRPRSLLRMIGG